MVVHYHPCTACTVLPTLDLKFILHYGSFVVQPIAGQEKLVGPEVNLVHRLLKNTVTQETGRRAYLLLTDAAAAHLALPPASGQSHEELYADVGVVAGVVVDIGGTSEQSLNPVDAAQGILKLAEPVDEFLDRTRGRG